MGDHVPPQHQDAPRMESVGQARELLQRLQAELGAGAERGEEEISRFRRPASQSWVEG